MNYAQHSRSVNRPYMRQLFLQRHAKADKSNPTVIDFDRPLHSEGLAEIKQMSAVLLNHNVKLDQIIASGAKRAIETAQTLAAYLHYPLEDIIKNKALYSADVTALIHVIQTLDDDHHSVMILSHNPHLSLLANYLCQEAADELSTCGVYCLTFSCHRWRDITRHSGQLQWLEFPGKHQ